MATITKENLGLLHEKISVNLAKEDYMPSFEKSLRDYSKKANIPGFRPGKVPSGMIKKMYGPSLFTDEILRSVDRELFNYLDSEKLEHLGQPLPIDKSLAEFDVNNPGEYVFEFEIGLRPEFELPDLEKAHITSYKVEITDDMVNEEVSRLQNRFGNVVDRETIDNDENVLNVVFTELDESGAEKEEGIVKDNSLLLKYFTGQAKKDLEGKKTGDSIQFKLGDAFEDKEFEFVAGDLGLDKEDAASHEKTFRLDITKVGLLEKRELKEDFFEQLFPGESVTTEEEFRAKLREQIGKQWQAESRNQIHDQIFHELVDHTTVEFPEAFLLKWLASQNQGKEGGPGPKTEEQLKEEMPEFLKQMKWNMIQEKILRENALEVTPDEIADFARQQLVGYLGTNDPETLNQPWVNDYVTRMMKDRRFVEDTVFRLNTEKVLGWAETKVKPVEKPISQEDFTKMVSEHHHHHHH